MLAWAPAAVAVLIDSGDGTGNVTPPPVDPGFANVGATDNGLSAVYVRNGWVLTANHVGERAVTFAGTSFLPVSGSRVRFANPDGSLADLIAYKLTERPALPDLLIGNEELFPGQDVLLVGNGRNRGGATSFMGIGGYDWGAGRTIRWGTNEVSDIALVELDTQAFRTTFDDLPGNPPGAHEADLVNGDSGGAAFSGSGPTARLIGILFARGGFAGQSASSSIYGNIGLVADLARYRSDILAVIDQPDCDDGLDDDGDGLVDYPDDPGCGSLGDDSEREPLLTCDNGLDDDGDGLVDMADPGCIHPTDLNERGAIYACDNGLDDDGDAFADYPDDPECVGPTGISEVPEPGFLAGLLAGALLLATRATRRP